MVYEEFMDSQNATSNDTPLVMRFLETSPRSSTCGMTGAST
ncbi:MAG: hypothetical protein ACLSAH_09515 [Bilophila wadsworthia]